MLNRQKHVYPPYLHYVDYKTKSFGWKLFGHTYQNSNALLIQTKMNANLVMLIASKRHSHLGVFFRLTG